MIQDSISKRKNQQAESARPLAEIISLALQAIRFGISGGCATFSHWLVMGVLVYQGAQATLASVIGAIVGSVFNYLLQYYWTFRSGQPHSTHIPAYMLTVIVSWLLNALIFHLFITTTLLGVGFSQLFTSAIVALMNFIFYRRIVFHERINRNPAS